MRKRSGFSITEFQKELLDRMSRSVTGSDNVVIFNAGQRLLAAAMSEIYRFSDVPGITPAPMSANWMLGAANVSGDVYLVTDLQSFMDGAKTEISQKSKLIVARGESKVALLVSKVMYMRDSSMIESLPEAEHPGDAWISKSMMMGQKRIDLLDVGELIRSDKFINAGMHVFSSRTGVDMSYAIPAQSRGL